MLSGYNQMPYSTRELGSIFGTNVVVENWLRQQCASRHRHVR